jgi:CRP-like cAMP-binding protein
MTGMSSMKTRVMTNIGERDRVQTNDGICDDFHETVAAHLVYRPRQVVFAEGHPSTGLHFVCHGAVKLFHSDPSGREYVMGIAGPGAVLGDLGDSTPRQSISAVALTQSRLAFLPRERLELFVHAYPGSAIRLMAILGRELAHTRRTCSMTRSWCRLPWSRSVASSCRNGAAGG